MAGFHGSLNKHARDCRTLIIVLVFGIKLCSKFLIIRVYSSQICNSIYLNSGNNSGRYLDTFINQDTISNLSNPWSAEKKSCRPTLNLDAVYLELIIFISQRLDIVPIQQLSMLASFAGLNSLALSLLNLFKTHINSFMMIFAKRIRIKFESWYVAYSKV